MFPIVQSTDQIISVTRNATVGRMEGPSVCEGEVDLSCLGHLLHPSAVGMSGSFEPARALVRAYLYPNRRAPSGPFR